MLAAVPLFFAEMGDRLELLAMKCLTVLGGFLAGNLAGRLGMWGFDRWVYKGTTPAGLKQTVGVVVGIVVALIIALLIFRFGDGGGTGGGRGPADGAGTAGAGDTKTDPKDAPPPKPEDKPPPKVEPVPTPEPKEADVPVRVTFLGGPDVVGDKFYLLDDRRLSFDELKAAVTKRKADAGTRKVFLIAQFPDKNRIADDSVNVTQVIEWARGLGLGVVLASDKR